MYAAVTGLDGLTPEFLNPDPFKPSGEQKAGKPRSFIADDPVEPVAGAGATGSGAGLQRRGSMQSTTTVEEDEIPVDESRTIPTLVSWPHGGNKVYITGTFCHWRKKYRLAKRFVSRIIN